MQIPLLDVGFEILYKGLSFLSFLHKKLCLYKHFCLIDSSNVLDCSEKTMSKICILSDLIFRFLGERKFNRWNKLAMNESMLTDFFSISLLVISLFGGLSISVWLLTVGFFVNVWNMLADLEEQKKGKYILIRDGEDAELGLFYKPLPCFGCGIGWFSWVKHSLLLSIIVAFGFIVSAEAVHVSSVRFLIGFVFPFAWYVATFLYFTNYYRRDPRERSGLAASAIAVSYRIPCILLNFRFLIFE